MGSIARMDPKYPQIVGTCPGLPIQLLARNHFFQSDRPEIPHFCWNFRVNIFEFE